MAPADREAVLDQLDGRQRARLAALADPRYDAPRSVSKTPPAAARLSAWLVESAGFDSGSQPSVSTPSRMAPHARQILRECMAEMRGETEEAHTRVHGTGRLASVLNRITGTRWLS